MTLEQIREIYKDDLQFQRERKKEEYRLRDGLIIDIFASDDDVVVQIPYPNNRLKTEHKPMRRMRHYGENKKGE